MVLNPAWFNALVDDTGTGTTGTVWNKAAIKGLSDAIDAELTRLNVSFNFWVPTLISAGGGTPAYSVQSGYYVIVANKLCYVGFRIVLTNKGSLAPGILSLANLPAVIAGTGSNYGGVTVPLFSGLAIPVASIGSYLNNGGTTMNLLYVPGGGGQAATWLDATHLSGGAIEITGSGIYAMP